MGAVLADAGLDGEGVLMTPVEWMVLMLLGGVAFGVLATLTQGRG